MTAMKKTYTIAIATFAGLFVASAGRAQVKLDSVRIGAKDSVAAAKFYEAAFGMQEVNRIQAPNGPIVIMHRDSDDVKDPLPHVILDVDDMTATVAAIKAAGGTMATEPRPFRNTGIVIGIAMDPAGNRVELIHRP
jgi:predicted enzyme related to lactoylglutathione lyase